MSWTLRRVRGVPLAVTFMLAGTASVCYNRDDYATSPERQAAALRLTATATSISADNFSRTTIKAAIDGAASGDSRVVRFTTTGGTLSGGTASSGAMEVTADGADTARVDLTSDLSERTVRVRAEIKGNNGFAREIDIVFTKVPDDLIKFAVVPVAPEADGQTPVNVTAELSSSVPHASQTVEFTAATGFVGAAPGATTISVVADATTRRATAEVKPPTTAQRVRVTASLNGFPRDTAIAFIDALPRAIILTPDAIAITNTQSTIVRARLVRSVGKVSPGTFVKFEAVDENGSLAGVMRDVSPSDTDGIATARFDAAGILGATIVTIRATVPNSTAQGTSTTIRVTPAGD